MSGTIENTCVDKQEAAEKVVSFPGISIPTMWGIKEAAEKTGLPVHFIRALVWDHKIRFVQAGSKKIFINAQSLADYLNGGVENV